MPIQLRSALRSFLVASVVSVPTAVSAAPLSAQYLFTVSDRYHYASGTSSSYSHQFQLTVSFDGGVTGGSGYREAGSARQSRTFGEPVLSAGLDSLDLPVVGMPAEASSFGFTEETRSADRQAHINEQWASVTAGLGFSEIDDDGWSAYTLGLSMLAHRRDSYRGPDIGIPTGESLLDLLGSVQPGGESFGFWLSSFALHYVCDGEGECVGGYSEDSYQYFGTYSTVEGSDPGTVSVAEPSLMFLVGSGAIAATWALRRRRS